MIELKLAELEFDVLTVVPIRNGWAPIGLVNLYNPGGTVLTMATETVSLMGGGSFTAWCQNRPLTVRVDGAEVPFEYENNVLRVQVDSSQNCEIKIERVDI